MTTATILWICVGIVAVIILATLAVVASRNSRAKALQRRQEDRERADDLRHEAREVGVEARRTEAGAATARADADQAHLEADRLEEHADRLEAEAEHAEAAARERLTVADRLDPDVDEDAAPEDRAAAHREAPHEQAPRDPFADGDPNRHPTPGEGDAFAAGSHRRSQPGESSPVTDDVDDVDEPPRPDER